LASSKTKTASSSVTLRQVHKLQRRRVFESMTQARVISYKGGGIVCVVVFCMPLLLLFSPGAGALGKFLTASLLDDVRAGRMGLLRGEYRC